MWPVAGVHVHVIVMYDNVRPALDLDILTSPPRTIIVIFGMSVIVPSVCEKCWAAYLRLPGISPDTAGRTHQAFSQRSHARSWRDTATEDILGGAWTYS